MCGTNRQGVARGSCVERIVQVLNKENNMDDDDTFYDMDQPVNDEDDADDDWGAWMLDNDTSVN